MNKLLSIFTLLALTALTTACNTVEGVGKDISAGGKKIEKAAEY